jgi:hypothetical protein
MDDKTRMRHIQVLNKDMERTRKHLQRCKLRKQEKTLSNSMFILILIAILTLVLMIQEVTASPLGGWDTFPGPVAEPVDCRPTHDTRCA